MDLVVELVAGAADALADEYAIVAADRAGYADRSLDRAPTARDQGSFEAEIVPVGDVRADRFRAPDADASIIDDGAAGVLLVDGSTHRRLRMPGLRVTAAATFGCDPARVGWSLVPAVERVLYTTRLRLDQFDVIEFDEAFSGNVLAAATALRIDPERICRQGGSLALGHPWGASGAVLMTRVFTQLVRQDLGRFGLLGVSAGSGQGVAMVVERC